MLPSMPLCVEPVNHVINGGDGSRNFVAIGSFEPEIEIWNGDIIDAACPTAILQGQHRDAVMTLAWNRAVPNALASGSADKTIVVWNLDRMVMEKRLKGVHKDKVQSVRWSPLDPHLLASASYDRTVCLTDARSFTHTTVVCKMADDPECVSWDPHHSEQLFVSDEAGLVSLFDTRSPTKPVLQIEAHGKACTALQPHPLIPSLLLTASTDRTLKVWDLSSTATTTTSTRCVVSREPGVGKIFAAAFAADSPFVVACAGSKGEVRVVELDESEVYCEVVRARLGQ
jgi:periodic tryptophan protein 1